MSKEIKVNAQAQIVTEAPKGDRAERWAKHVANYKMANPVKWAAKNARKEFDVIPETFK